MPQILAQRSYLLQCLAKVTDFLSSIPRQDCPSIEIDDQNRLLFPSIPHRFQKYSKG